MKHLLLFACASFIWAQAPASNDPVVLTVGSEKITKSQFERILDTLPEQQKAVASSPEGRRQLAERIAELKTLAQEARTRKLDQDSTAQTRIALQGEQILASMLYQQLTAGNPDEAALKAYYEEHKSESQDVKAKHILVRSKGSRVPIREGQQDLSDEEALAKAKDIKAKLTAGAKFEDLAKAESDDTGSGEQGGDLGSIERGQTVPEFEEAVFAQPVGQVGEPVKTQFGYHLILVSSRGAKSFEDMKSEIAKRIKPEQAQKGIEELVKKNGIKYDEAYFGPSAK